VIVNRKADFFLYKTNRFESIRDSSGDALLITVADQFRSGSPCWWHVRSRLVTPSIRRAFSREMSAIVGSQHSEAYDTMRSIHVLRWGWRCGFTILTWNTVALVYTLYARRSGQISNRYISETAKDNRNNMVLKTYAFDWGIW